METGYRKHMKTQNNISPKHVCLKLFNYIKGKLRQFINNWNIVYNKCKHISNSALTN